jgi:hypothetical protein
VLVAKPPRGDGARSELVRLGLSNTAGFPTGAATAPVAFSALARA